jgi:hypothetical protein
MPFPCQDTHEQLPESSPVRTSSPAMIARYAPRAAVMAGLEWSPLLTPTPASPMPMMAYRRVAPIMLPPRRTTGASLLRWITGLPLRVRRCDLEGVANQRPSYTTDLSTHIIGRPRCGSRWPVEGVGEGPVRDRFSYGVGDSLKRVAGGVRSISIHD